MSGERMSGEGYPYPLSQAAAYSIIVAMGIPFAVVMSLLALLLSRYQKINIDATEFATAGRCLSSGIVAVNVIVTWTWIPAIFVSSSQAYNNGVFGPISHATGASAQIFTFAVLALELKRKMPNAYTYLELIKLRHGALTHAIYILYALGANTMSMGMLIAGCAEVAQELTGMNTFAACFLTPLGVTIYTLAGGLKATMITGYVHLLIMFIVLLMFAFVILTNYHGIGSIGAFYDMLKAVGEKTPHPGNKDGSYLTFRSDAAAEFMVTNLISCFATGFLDTAFWNKAIAAGPRALYPGYFSAGIMWFSIPWVLATSMGIGGLILQSTPEWPTYPHPETMYQSIVGMTLPFAAVTILGKGGGGAALMMIYMASCSTMAGEMVSVSTIWTYDVYRAYINPNASERRLLWQTRISVNVFTLAMIGFSIGLMYGKIGPGFLFQLLGIILSPAVLTIALNLFWSGINTWASLLAPPIGTATGLAAWVGITGGLNNSTYGMATLIQNYPMMGANLVAIGTPAIVVVICQLLGGHAHFNFLRLRNYIASCDAPPVNGSKGTPQSLTPQGSNPEMFASPDTMSRMALADSSTQHSNQSSSSQHRDSEHGGAGSVEKKSDGNGKHGLSDASLSGQASTRPNVDFEKWERHIEMIKEDEAILEKHRKIAIWVAIFMLLALLVVFPVPLYASGYIFSKDFFKGWVIVSLIWMLLAAIWLLTVPLWQGRYVIVTTIRNMWWDVSGQSRKMRAWQAANPERMHAPYPVEDWPDP